MIHKIYLKHRNGANDDTGLQKGTHKFTGTQKVGLGGHHYLVPGYTYTCIPSIMDGVLVHNIWTKSAKYIGLYPVEHFEVIDQLEETKGNLSEKLKVQ